MAFTETEAGVLAVDKAETIKELIERDGFRCMYPTSPTEFCDKPLEVEENARHSVTIDHIYPKARAKAEGWTFEQIWGLENLQLMGKACNAKKSDLLYNDDGTLPEKYRDRTIKVPRPDNCDFCMNGRLLNLDETCPLCYSGPQPATFPKVLQRTPKECDHHAFHCWMCLVHQPELRVPAYEDVFGVED